MASLEFRGLCLGITTVAISTCVAPQCVEWLVLHQLPFGSFLDPALLTAIRAMCTIVRRHIFEMAIPRKVVLSEDWVFGQFIQDKILGHRLSCGRHQARFVAVCLLITNARNSSMKSRFLIVQIVDSGEGWCLRSTR